MKPEYAAWISAYVQRTPVFGSCHKAANEMACVFPELRSVRGHVHDASWGKRSHGWCVAPDGEIIDPTASQFPALLEYEEWKPGDEIRVGKCMECGEVLWAPVRSLDEPGQGRHFCDEHCARAFENALYTPDERG